MKKLLTSYFVLALGFTFSLVLLPWIVRNGGKDIIALSVLISSGITYICLSDLGLSSFLSRGKIVGYGKPSDFDCEELNLIRNLLPAILMRSVVITALGYVVLQDYGELSDRGVENSILIASLLLLIAIVKPMDSIYQGYLLGQGAITRLNVINIVNILIRWGGIAVIAITKLNILFIYLIYGLISLPSTFFLIRDLIGRVKNKINYSKYEITKKVFLSTITGTIYVSIDKYLVVNSGLDIDMINGYIICFGAVAPILSVIYPIMQISQYKITGNKNQKKHNLDLYKKIIILTVGLYVIPLFFIIASANQVVPIWLGQNFASTTNILNIKIALLSAIFYGISHIISMEIISNMKYEFITNTNLISILVMVIGVIIQNHTNIYLFIYFVLSASIIQLLGGVYYLVKNSSLKL